MSMPYLVRLSAFTAALVLLASCSVYRVDQSAKRAEESADTAQQYAALLRNKRAEAARETVRFSSKPWVATTPLVAARGMPLQLDKQIAYRPTTAVTISEVAQYISTEIGLPVVVTPDAANPTPVQQQINRSTPAGDMSDLFPGGANGTLMGATFNPSRTVSGIKHNGPVSSLLDLVTNRLGLSWVYDNQIQGVRINYFETRTFDVWAFGDDQEIESTVRSGLITSTGTSSGSSGGGNGSGSESSGASGESGSSQSTKVTIKTSLLGDIEQNVKSMLSVQPAGRMFLSRTTGTLTVSDRPDVLNRISTYIQSINRSITRQIVFNVTVFEVSLTDRDQLGVNWSAVYKSISRDWGFSLANSVAGISSDAITGSVGILDTASSPWAGTEAVIQALAQQGRISNIRNPSVTTLNLQPAPIQIGNVQSYIAGSSTTTTASVGTSTSLTPATITSGFNMMLLPKVIDRDNLLLMINLSMSSRPTFKTFDSNDASVQTADYDTKNAAPKVKLRSGQTLVLTGFEESREDANLSGVESPRFFGLGGGRTRTSEHSILVVLVTPVVEPDPSSAALQSAAPIRQLASVPLAADSWQF